MMSRFRYSLPVCASPARHELAILRQIYPPKASRQEELAEMLASLEKYRPRLIVWDAIMAAYTDSKWDWYVKSDGCTGVPECYYPKTMRSPPCVMHDHQCELVRRGMTTRRRGDRLFRWAMQDYLMSRWQVWGRWVGVRCAWIFWLKWQ